MSVLEPLISQYVPPAEIFAGGPHLVLLDRAYISRSVWGEFRLQYIFSFVL